MFVGRPIEINDSNLTSDIPEPDISAGEVEWYEKDNWEPYLDDAANFDGRITGVAKEGGDNDRWNVIVDSDTVRRVDSLVDPDTNYVILNAVATETYVDLSFYAETFWMAVRDSGTGNTEIRQYSENGGPVITSFVVDTTSRIVRGAAVVDDVKVAVLFDLGSDDFEIGFYSFDGTEDTSSKITGKTGGLVNMAGLSYFGDQFYMGAYGAAIVKCSLAGVVTSTGQGSVSKVFSLDALGVYEGVLYVCGKRTQGTPDTYTAKYIAGTLDPVYWQAGERAILTSTHKLYECVTPNNDSPDVGVLASPKTWSVISGTNKYAMFDGVISNQSNASASPLVIELDSGEAIDTIAGFNIAATSVNITVTDPVDGEVYNNDVPIRDNSGVLGYWELWTLPIIDKKAFLVTDLPFYPNATVTLTFESAGDILVGEIVYCRKLSLGVAQYGTAFNLLNFNTFKRDDFGTVTRTTGRKTADQFTFKVKIKEDNNLYVRNLLKEYADTQGLWLGSDVNGEDVVVLGYYQDVTVNWSSPTLHDCSLRIEGVI